MRALFRVFAALCLLLFLPPPAAAEEPAANPEALCVVKPAGAQKPVTAKIRKQIAGHLDAAGSAYQSRQFSVAITELQAVYELDPQTEVLFNLAQTCREAGRDLEALALYEKTLGETKDDSTKADCERHIEGIHNKLAAREDERAGKLLLDKEYSLAIKAWEQAYQHNKSPAFLFQIAQAQRLGKQIDNAIASYQKFLETAPENAFAPETKEHLLRLRADKDDARALKLFEEKNYAETITA